MFTGDIPVLPVVHIRLDSSEVKELKQTSGIKPIDTTEKILKLL